MKFHYTVFKVLQWLALKFGQRSIFNWMFNTYTLREMEKVEKKLSTRDKLDKRQEV